jgi:tRNA threonylcarbamoyladenosine biosynthesis protein TsaB
MQILSIDTSGQIFSIAILKQDAIELLEYPASKTNSEKILPEIRAMMSRLSINFSDIDGIAFGAGPGSFTGVRIASGIAYGIAYSLKIPIVGVNNLEALATVLKNKYCISCIDARMKQVYLGVYQLNNRCITSISPPGLYDPDALPDINIPEATIIGSGVAVYKNQLAKKYKHINLNFINKEYPLAGVIAKLALPRMNKSFDLSQAQPIYIRNKVAQTILERNT